MNLILIKVTVVTYRVNTLIKDNLLKEFSLWQTLNHLNLS